MKLKRKSGLLITLEGPEGSGKTTLANVLYRYLKGLRIPVLLTHEPGGSSFGKVLRKVLLKPVREKMTALTELFLFEADRAQHVEEVILPALRQGKIVLCCRYSDSTTAYQGYGRGLGMPFVTELNRRATGGLEPHLTLLLDLAPERGLPRAFKARGDRDRMESESLAFHRRLRKGYLKLARQYPQRVRVIKADQDIEDVKAQALACIRALLSREKL